MSSAYAKYPARYLFVPRSSARINTGRGCPLLPVIFVSPRYAAVRCIAAGCAVYVLSAVLDIGSDNTMNCYRQGYVRMQNVQHIAAGVQYMYRQPCWILAVTMQYIAVGEVMYVCQLCSIFAGRAVYLLLAVPDLADDYAIYRRRLCNAPVGFRTDIPAETDLTARPRRLYRCPKQARVRRRSALRCRHDRRAQLRVRVPRRRGRYTSRIGRCSSGRR